MRHALLVLLLAACAAPTQRTLAAPHPCTSWGILPLVIAVDASALRYRPALNRAAQAWTDALGEPAFVWAYLPQARPDVVVEVGPVPGDIANATMTSSECRHGRVLTHVLLAPTLDDGAALGFAEHGLGHALGLGHATNEQSIMQPELDVGLMGTWDDEHTPPLLRITEGDAEIVRVLHRNASHLL